MLAFGTFWFGCIAVLLEFGGTPCLVVQCLWLCDRYLRHARNEENMMCGFIDGQHLVARSARGLSLGSQLHHAPAIPDALVGVIPNRNDTRVGQDARPARGGPFRVKRLFPGAPLVAMH